MVSDLFYLPSRWQVPGRRRFLRFAQVGHYASVYVNGQLAGQNWGQFAPFQYEITPCVLTGNNTVSVYVHNSDSTYAYQGANLNQSGCASSGLPSNCEALAYRSAANDPVSRNWIGITGDVSLFWRPSSYIQSVAIAPSLRNNSLSAEVTVAGEGNTSSVIGGPSMARTSVQAGIPTMLPAHPGQITDSGEST